MKKCTNCSEWIKEEDKYCFHCGVKVEQTLKPEGINRKKNDIHPYEVVTVLFLILSFPIGLLIMWIFRPFSRNTRWIISVILIGISLLGLLLIILWTSSPGYLY
ncbi:MAG: hypothetical protein KKE16_00235 [Firmicutes bacterium]|nr:hypothetical protein [Bacillota bacterium]